MGRRAVEIEVILLHVLAMIAFAVGQTEEALFKDGVLPVPQRQREAELLLVIGNPCQAIFSPAIGARAGLIVCKVIPCIASLAVILAYRSPLSFTQVGT